MSLTRIPTWTGPGSRERVTWRQEGSPASLDSILATNGDARDRLSG